MPKIRNRGRPSETRSGYRSPDETAPSQLGAWNHSLSNATRTLPPLFPDVPLNPEHRYCTPPPLDPRYNEEAPLHIDEDPKHSAQAPDYPGDFDFDFDIESDKPPPSIPGSRENPIFVAEMEDENDRLQTRKRRQSSCHSGDATPAPRRSLRTPPRPSESSAPRQNVSTGSSVAPTTTRAASSSRNSPRKPSPSSRKPPKASLSGFNKTAANPYSPVKSSPLSKVAYRAPSEQPLHSTPTSDALSSEYMQSGWYPPPTREHSIGSGTVTSGSSNDSDSD